MSPVPELTDTDTQAVFQALAAFRDELRGMVHAHRGDDRREVRDALLQVAFRLDALDRDLRVRLQGPAGPGSPPALDGPGQVTADVVRRMRHNRGGQHRAAS